MWIARFLLLTIFVLTFPSLPPDEVFGKDPKLFPKQKGSVNDFAGSLQPEVVSRLEAYLKEFSKEKCIDVVVVTVDDPPGDITHLEKDARAIATEWGVGGKTLDRGVVLLFTRGGVAFHMTRGLVDLFPEAEGALRGESAKLLMPGGNSQPVVTTSLKTILKILRGLKIPEDKSIRRASNTGRLSSEVTRSLLFYKLIPSVAVMPLKGR